MKLEEELKVETCYNCRLLMKKTAGPMGYEM
jgi:hypothetical protein